MVWGTECSFEVARFDPGRIQFVCKPTGRKRVDIFRSPATLSAIQLFRCSTVKLVLGVPIAPVPPAIVSPRSAISAATSVAAQRRPPGIRSGRHAEIVLIRSPMRAPLLPRTREHVLPPDRDTPLNNRLGDLSWRRR